MPRLELRSRHMDLTRDLILEAVAALVTTQGSSNFSLQEVAERAGVSVRTLYRHFESREALLDALVVWVEEQVRLGGGMDLPSTADDIPRNVKVKFAMLDKYAPLLISIIKLDNAGLTHSAQSERGLEAIRRALSEVTRDLDPRVAEVVVWTIRQICSVRTWLVLREEAGIDGGRAGDVAAWAAEVLIEALRQGRGPRVSSV